MEPLSEKELAAEAHDFLDEVAAAVQARLKRAGRTKKAGKKSVKKVVKKTVPKKVRKKAVQKKAAKKKAPRRRR